MTPRRWLPIKVWVTAAFSISVACVIACLGLFVYWRTSADLLSTIDAGLRSRAEVLVTSVQRGHPIGPVEPTLIEGDEVFAQIVSPAGHIIRSSSVLAGRPLLPAEVVRSASRSAIFERTLPHVDDVARILLVPVQTSRGAAAVIVGASLGDRHDALTQLLITLAVGGGAAVALLCAGSWLALTAALRPVEQMRRQADGISAAGSGSRLTLPRSGDEIASLGSTLNRMLGRIEDSVERERRLIDRTSHELRTPLAIQRIDLDLALSGGHEPEELAAALRSVSQENEHLVRLTDDLLVLSRARGGALPVRLEDVTLAELLDDARRRINAANPPNADGQITYSAADAHVRVDRAWFRQAAVNLVDNARRHTAANGPIEVRIDHGDGQIRLVVNDSGAGFDEDFLSRAFDPFARRTTASADGQSTGLGLAIVQAIAEAHHGHAWAENRRDGGASVTMAISDGVSDAR